jgi:hypothetical protein
MALAFEQSYGVPPTTGYTRMNFASSTLAAGQPLLASELLGYGRDPVPPVLDAITVDGDVVVPIDQRAIGYWLKAAFGPPETTEVAASGTITFAANPAAGDTITLGGTVWTFVDDAPGAEETEIAGTLEATLAALVTGLNASADPEIAKAAYSNPEGTDDLLIVFDGIGVAGNAFTIAASAATVSRPTLTGGGWSHFFASGAWELPSMTIEVGMPEVPHFALFSGCMVDQLSWSMQRSGLLTATARVVAQGEVPSNASHAGELAELALRRFGHFNGSIRREGVQLANVVSAEVSYQNNLDRVETIRGDGRIDGADPSMAAFSGRMDVRFADTTLRDQAVAGLPSEMEFGWRSIDGASLTFRVPAVYLPRPRLELSGPQGVQATFEWQAAQGGGAMCEVTLINDVEAY